MAPFGVSSESNIATVSNGQNARSCRSSLCSNTTYISFVRARRYTLIFCRLFLTEMSKNVARIIAILSVIISLRSVGRKCYCSGVADRHGPSRTNIFMRLALSANRTIEAFGPLTAAAPLRCGSEAELSNRRLNTDWLIVVVKSYRVARPPFLTTTEHYSQRESVIKPKPHLHVL